MDETANYDQIQQLITRLDQKVAEINATRTDPQAIASQITANLQGFIGVMISNFISKKKEEEEELKRPRELIQPLIPIDIVRVSPTAADQIASALEAAGIGKYNIKINQINKQSDTAGGAAGILKALGSVVSWAAGTLAKLMWRFKAPLGAVLGIVGAGAMAANLFEDEISTLLNIADNPQQVFDQSDESEQDQSQTVDFNDISQTSDFQQSLNPDSPQTGTAMDRFLSTPTGANYIKQIESRAGEEGQQTRDQITSSVDMMTRQMNDVLDMTSKDQDIDSKTSQEFKTKYMEQALSEEGITKQFLQDNVNYLAGDGDEQTRVTRALTRVSNDATNMQQLSRSSSDIKQAVEQISSGQITSDAFLRSTRYTDMLIQDSDDVMQTQYGMLKDKAQPSTPQINQLSTSPPDTMSVFDMSNMPGALSLPESQSDDSATIDNTDMINKMQQLIDINNQELETSNEQLASIYDALQSIPTDQSVENNDMIMEAEDDMFDVETVRGMVDKAVV